MRKHLLQVAAFLTAAVILYGCSKSSSTTNPPSSTAPTIPSVTFSGPTTTSSDQYAQMTKSYALMFNGLSSYFTAYQGLHAAQNGNTWSWTYSNPATNFTGTLTVTQQSSGGYSWKLVLNGKESATDTVTYNNWTAMTGTTSSDGKSGSWTIYNENTAIIAALYTWSTSSSGTLTGTLKSYSNTGTLEATITVTNNPDKSGEVDIYSGTTLVFKATWIANGSGQWWTYDNSGTQTGTGTWT